MDSAKSVSMDSKVTVVSVLITLVVILSISCLIAPQVKRLFLALAPHSSFFSWLSEYELHRILSRVVLVIGGVCVVIFRKTIFHNGSLLMTLKPNRRNMRLFGLAFAVGVLTLFTHVMCAVYFGARPIEYAEFTWYDLFRRMVHGFFSATVIGVMEEFIFRGLLFGSLEKRFSFKRAVIISSAVYACMHFFQPKEIVGIDQTAFWSGFIVLGQMITPFFSPDFIFGSVGLFLVGACLAVGYHYTRSLYFSIGLHAGWVWIIKVDGAIAGHTLKNMELWWGGSQLVGGVFTWVLLLIVLFLLRITLAPRTAVKNG